MTDEITETQELVDFSKAPQRILSAALCHTEDAWCVSRVSTIGGLYLDEYCPAEGPIEPTGLLPNDLLDLASLRRFSITALCDNFQQRISPVQSSWAFFAITKATYPVMTDGAALISLLPTVSPEDEDVTMYAPPSVRITNLSSAWSYGLSRLISDSPVMSADTVFCDAVKEHGPLRMMPEVQWTVDSPNPLAGYRGTLPIWELGHAGYGGQRCRYSGRLQHHLKPETATYLWGSRAAAELVSCYMVQRINLTWLDGEDDKMFVYHEAVAFPGYGSYDRARRYIGIQATLIADTCRVYPDTMFNRTLFKSSTPSVYAVQPRSGLYGVRSVPLVDAVRDQLLALKGVTLFSDVVMNNGPMRYPFLGASMSDEAKRKLVEQHQDDIIGVITGGCWD